MKDYKIRYS